MIGIDIALKTLGVLIIKFEALSFTMILLLFMREIISLIFGEKNKGESNHILLSSFLSALTVFIFHFMTSEVRDFTFSFEVEKMKLRKLFYLSMFMMELLFVIALFYVHRIKKCPFYFVAHFCFMTSSIMCLIQLIQLYLRGFLDLDSFVPYYKLTVVSINLLVLVVISIYPIHSLYKLFNIYNPFYKK